AISRQPVAVVRLLIGLCEVRPNRESAGIRVLDDRGRRVIELERETERSGRVLEVVEGQLRALELAQPAQPATLARHPVEGALLVRVLSIAQRLGEIARERHLRREK